MKTTALDYLLDNLHGAMKSTQDDGVTIKMSTVIARTEHSDHSDVTAGVILLAMIELSDIKQKLNE